MMFCKKCAAEIRSVLPRDLCIDCTKDEKIESLQQQLAEEQSKVTAQGIALGNLTESFARSEQERDKLLACVQGKDEALYTSAKTFRRYQELHCFKGKADKAEANGERAAVCEAALNLTPENLPRFVPEEKLTASEAALTYIREQYEVKEKQVFELQGLLQDIVQFWELRLVLADGYKDVPTRISEATNTQARPTQDCWTKFVPSQFEKEGVNP